MKSIWVFVILTVLSSVIFFKSFLNFFAQDDFVLLNYFSGNNVVEDLRRVFSWPTVTHFRPLHNLFFFVSGNLFGHSFFSYHLLLLLIHVVGAAMVYKVVLIISDDKKKAVISSVVYVTSASHFVSLFWISGGATSLGFLFLISSFFFYLVRKNVFAYILFLASVLASESMVAGLALFVLHFLLFEKKQNVKFILAQLATAIAFTTLRLIFFTNTAAIEAYNFKVGPETLETLKYYLLRIVGFAEGSGSNLASILLIFLNITLVFLFRKQNLLLFSGITALAGLFPFILIPYHLAANYMNISIFGYSIFFATVVSRLRWTGLLAMMVIYVAVAAFNVNLIYDNHWVVKRARLASNLMDEIETKQYQDGTTIVFDTQEAYFALGGKDGIKFWFGDKYNSCFAAYEKCKD